MAAHKDHGSGNWTSRTGDGFERDAGAEGDGVNAAESDADGNATKSDCDGISEGNADFLAEARAAQPPRRSSADRF
jgi:hypothetical protein